MRGTKAKAARRFMKSVLPRTYRKHDPSALDITHTNVQQKYVGIPSGVTDPDTGKERVRKLHYTTSTVSKPVRQIYQRLKKTI